MIGIIFRYIGLALSATCFAGFLSLLLGLLRQGQLVTFVSPQVLAGFVSSSALVIIVNQIASYTKSLILRAREAYLES